LSAGERTIPEETAVAISYNRFSYAVMMATPADLKDFAVGFSLSAGVIAAREEIEDIEIAKGRDGIELRVWLSESCIRSFTTQRRYIAGPTGCGLCGVESLAVAMRSPPCVTSAFQARAQDLMAAMESLPALQQLNRQAHAVHAAAFWEAGKGIVALREDIGRHNALDKLIGTMIQKGLSAAGGAILLTSRVSVELIQKAAILGAPIVMAVSAPTALARRFAERAGIALLAVAREDGFEVFAHGERVQTERGPVSP
jgi:FdhD protein